jgi:hypothetical protein
VHLIFDAWGRESVLNGSRKILQNDFTRKLGVLGLELGRLMADIAADVNEERPLRSEARCVFLDWIYLDPGFLILPPCGHVLIEGFEIGRMAHEPVEAALFGIMCILKHSVVAIGGIVIAHLAKECRHFLIAKTYGIESATC